MSSDILKLIPTDPRWQPGPLQVERARDLAARLAPTPPGQRDWEIEIATHEAIEFIDCGSNLETITCPRCGTDIDIRWWAEQLGERYDNGFDDLATITPCCLSACGLDELDYSWPCGFARFEIRIWNPDRDLFTPDELGCLGETLGHPVRQVMVHI